MFVRGPQSLLRSQNVVDPGPFRAFLASAKRRQPGTPASPPPAAAASSAWPCQPPAPYATGSSIQPPTCGSRSQPRRPLAGTAYPENPAFTARLQ